jgi:hypothetical protein
MPTASDLVTDLPADFETFGQAVATSMADLLGGTTGQILSKASNTDMDFTWITNDVGDITAVTAGTGLTGGGTSGAVSLAIDSTVTTLTGTQTLTNKTLTSPVLTTPSISNIDAKGDLLAGTADNTIGRVAVGANGTVLTADSAEATGVKWATPATSASGLTLITSSPFTTVSSHSINSCFTSTYVNYLILITFTAASASGPNVDMRMRASSTDTTSGYLTTRLYSLGSTVGADTANTDSFYITGLNSSQPTEPSATLTLFNPQTTSRTSMISHGQVRGASSTNQLIVSGCQDSATQFDGLTLRVDSGTMSGTVRVYGYQNS